jgi:hypothetical protein
MLSACCLQLTSSLWCRQAMPLSSCSCIADEAAL